MGDFAWAIVLGLVTFISPCVLPLLPVFVSYFSAGNKTKRIGMFFKVLAFCLGISVVFLTLYISLAFLSTSLSFWIDKHRTEIFIVSGMVLVLLGLKFMGYLDIPFLNKSITYTPKKKAKKNKKDEKAVIADTQNSDMENVNTEVAESEGNDTEEGVNLLNAFIMGLVFSLSIGSCAIGWSVTLTELIIMAENQFMGIMIGVLYTLTVDVMFIIVAMLLNQLKGVLKFIQKNQGIISKICGGIMVFLGVFIALGFMDKMTLWFG